jgi:uncharacterized caspase-like protein
MLIRATVLFALLAAAFLPAAAHAERRVALVIGNSAYANAPTLRNPRNDAGDVADTLKKLGFEVEFGLDLDQQNFAKAIDGFARSLDGADVGLFFYAGHGLQMNDKNYLVSTNARLNSEFLLSSETIELDAIVRLMDSKATVNLVFLDACRNNPLAENLRANLAATKRSASLGRGLARIEPTGHDTLIAFAAAPGQEAADGRDRNSPFTASLLKRMPQPDLEVSVMLKEVAADVRRETRNSQRPQQLSDMSKTFYFAKTEPKSVVAAVPPPPPPPASAGDDRALDVAYWTAAQSANDCEATRAYLRRFPNGVFLELAKLAERRLCSSRTLTVLDAPSAAPPAVAQTPAIPADSISSPTPAPPPAVAPVPPLASAAETPAATPAPPPRIAALPEPSATPADAETPRPDLARDIMLELQRLGCVTGKVDGNWGPSARAAVNRFNRYARTALDPEIPTSATQTALRARDTRICPLECGRGFRVEDDTCVAIAPARTKARKADRPPERHKPQARSEREPQVRPEREPRKRPERAAATPAKSEFASPLCQSRIQVGSKWCCTYDPERGPSVIICR